eukprot:SAG31_NODE_37215_length_306_cov_0.753623_1_plen_51_part_10
MGTPLPILHASLENGRPRTSEPRTVGGYATPPWVPRSAGSYVRGQSRQARP